MLVIGNLQNSINKSPISQYLKGEIGLFNFCELSTIIMSHLGFPVENYSRIKIHEMFKNKSPLTNPDVSKGY